MANQVEITVGAKDSTALDLDRLKARIEDLKRQRATITIDANDKDATLKAARIDAQIAALSRKVASPKIGVTGAARAEADIASVDLAMSRLGKNSAGAGGGLASMVTPMAGVLAGAVALSPVIATVGFGTVGFGAAAAGVVMPLMKAAHAAGGLQANMAKLDPEQQAAARSLLTLQDKYRGFENVLKPVVLKDFGIAVGFAGHLLHDLEPVAKATGTALGGLLHQVDAEFQSKQWQSFFGWMAAQAGPDIRQLGGLVVDLTKDLPTLFKELQPVAHGFLVLADDIVKAADAYISFIHAEEHKANQQGTIFTQIKDWLKYGYGDSYKKQVLAAAAAQDALTLRLKDAHTATADLIHPVDTFTHGLQSSKVAAQQETGAVNTLDAALTKMAGGVLTAEQDQVAWRQAQRAATQAIDQNKHSLDSNRASALTARAAVIASTQAALAFAQQEVKQTGNTDAASRVIRDQIRYLQDHAGKSKIAAQEINALRTALHNLPANTRANVNVSGSGSGKITFAEQVAGQRASGFLEFHAAGGPVRGMGTGTSDSNLIAASRGEYVVKAASVSKYGTRMMDAINAGRFAGGGLVGSQSALTRGIPYEAARETSAGVAAAQGAVHSLAVEARKLAQVFSFAAGGPGGGAPAANAALARRMFPQENFAAWNYVAMRESGWNQFARNPSSGAYGIPQALPESKLPFAGQARGGSNPAAQIGWMEGYMRSVYGGAAGAAAHERAYNWYGSGLDAIVRRPTLIGVGERGAEHVQVTPAGHGTRVTLRIGHGGGHILEQALKAWITETVRVDGGGSVEVAFGS